LRKRKSADARMRRDCARSRQIGKRRNSNASGSLKRRRPTQEPRSSVGGRKRLLV
jgi:hypothetical protein